MLFIKNSQLVAEIEKEKQSLSNSLGPKQTPALRHLHEDPACEGKITSPGMNLSPSKSSATAVSIVRPNWFEGHDPLPCSI